MNKKDKELTLAYQKGILDERKEWQEKEKNFNKIQDIIKRQKRFCFCMGDSIWRPICSECQDYRKEILSSLLKEWILINNKKKDIKDFFLFFGESFKKDLDKTNYDIKNCSPKHIKKSEEKA